MIKRPQFIGPIPALATALFCAGFASASLAEPQLKSDDDKAAYGVGFAVGTSVKEQLGGFGLSKSGIDIAIAAINDALTDTEPKTDIEAALTIFQTKLEAKAKAELEKKNAENKAVLDKQASTKGAERLESGLVFIEQKAGDGAAPGADKAVKVHYVGTLPDGSTFDSSRARGEPAVFPLNGVIPCFSEGIQKMKVGGQAKLVCPPEIAYGERGSPPAVPPNAVLIFDVELISIEEGS